MRHTIVLLLSLLLIGVGGCQLNGSGDPAAVPPVRPVVASWGGSSTATLIVHGMGCPLCANNIDKQLLAVPGVETVQVNLGSGSVLVTMAEDNRPTSDQLADAVQQSGYTLVRIDRP